jgi:hypothetical protein
MQAPYINNPHFFALFRKLYRLVSSCGDFIGKMPNA